MKIAITGHRPEKLSSISFIEASLRKAYRDTAATLIIQGMAAGVDLMSAKIAYQMGLPWICAKPWEGHKPRRDDEINYQRAIDLAQEVVSVNPSLEYPGPWVYQKRNEWMVDNSEIVVAVWDGTKGGTFNCVNYAKKKKMPIYRIDPLTETGGWYANETI